MAPKLRDEDLRQVQAKDMKVPGGTYSKYTRSDYPLIPGVPLCPLSENKNKTTLFKMPFFVTVFFHS